MGDKRVLEDPVANNPEQTTRQSDSQLREDAYGKSPRTGDNKAAIGRNVQQEAASTTTPEVENPYTHIQKAKDLYSPGDPGKQDAKSAEEEWKKAIGSADKLPIDEYEKRLAKVQSQIKTESDPLKERQLISLGEGLQELIDLPATLRMETAAFYLQNSRPKDAEAMLKEALLLDPALKDREQFKHLVQASHENPKGTLDKAVDSLKSSGKELLSDGIAGGVGLVAFSLTPGGRALKLGSALLAGGATKHGLSLAGLGGDPNAPLKNFAWGGVDALAMVSGTAVRDKMMASFDATITSDAARKMAEKGGVQGYKFLFEGRSGLDGVKTATTLLTEEVAAKKAIYRQELRAAIAEAPWYEKPLLWAQKKIPFAPGESAWQKAKSEYLEARGSTLGYLNPINMFRSPSQFDGSLQNLRAITFWNRYKIDALSIGATSLVYRGAHDAAKIGDVDPNTGRTFSAYDAATNVAGSVATDALAGALMVGLIRPWGNWYAGFVEDVPVNQTVRVGLGSLRTAGALFNPELFQAHDLYDKASQNPTLLKEIQKPLEDKNENKPRSR